MCGKSSQVAYAYNYLLTVCQNVILMFFFFLGSCTHQILG